MPLEFTVDLTRRQVECRIHGVLLPEELQDYHRQVVQHPGWHPSFDELTDTGEITDTSMTTEDLRLQAEITPFGPGSRRAIVAPDDYIFGLVRMYQVMQEKSGSTLHVFRDMDEAQAWLAEERELET